MFMAASAGGTLARPERASALRDHGSQGAWGFDAASQSFHGLRSAGIRFQPPHRFSARRPRPFLGGRQAYPETARLWAGAPGWAPVGPRAEVTRSNPAGCFAVEAPTSRLRGRVLTGCRTCVSLAAASPVRSPRGSPFHVRHLVVLRAGAACRGSPPNCTPVARAGADSSLIRELGGRWSTIGRCLRRPAASYRPDVGCTGGPQAAHPVRRSRATCSAPRGRSARPILPSPLTILRSTGYLVSARFASRPVGVWQGRGACATVLAAAGAERGTESEPVHDRRLAQRRRYDTAGGSVSRGARARAQPALSTTRYDRPPCLPADPPSC